VPGWLLVAPRRHVEQLDQLEADEARELGTLLKDVSAALRQAAGGEKIYLAVFAEILPHLHFHVVARPPGWPAEERGAALLRGSQAAPLAEAARVAAAALGLLARGPAHALPGTTGSRSHKALLLSALVCPGLGQLANGERAKGLALIGATLVGTVWLAWRLAAQVLGQLPDAAALADPLAWERTISATREQSAGPLALATLLLGLLWAYSAWDAHRHSRG
jgi:diadenosine tetraphosphate (Ap4A) HIT family hydrolase